jgi:hypothetical protein
MNLLIFLVKTFLMLLDCVSLDDYLQNRALRSAVLSAFTSTIYILMARIIIADKDDGALVASVAAIFCGTIIAVRFREFGPNFIGLYLQQITQVKTFCLNMMEVTYVVYN